MKLTVLFLLLVTYAYVSSSHAKRNSNQIDDHLESRPYPPSIPTVAPTGSSINATRVSSPIYYGTALDGPTSSRTFVPTGSSTNATEVSPLASPTYPPSSPTVVPTGSATNTTKVSPPIYKHTSLDRPTSSRTCVPTGSSTNTTEPSSPTYDLTASADRPTSSRTVTNSNKAS